MFENIKKGLYFSKLQILFKKGFEDGSIVPFDDSFYERLSHTYIKCIPVSMHIKYLKPIVGPGKCLDRSLYMFLCFDDALLVIGDLKNLELKYGKEHMCHGWIELGDYVYDPSLLLRFKKDVYYKLYCPTNVHKCNVEQYVEDNKEFYDDIKQTTLDDYKLGGKKRIELCVMIPLLKGIADKTNNEEFKRDLLYYLSSIQYDEQQISEELNAKFQSAYKKKNL